MLTKRQVLELIIDLQAVSDIELVRSNSVLNEEVCTEKDRSAVREAARLIELLDDSFDYVKSVEFEGSVVGKSEAYRAMKARLVQQVEKRVQLKERMRDALREILTSQDAKSLFPLGMHGLLDQLRDTVEGLSNPL